MAPRPAMFPQIIYWYPTPPVSPQTLFTTNGGPSMVIMRGLPFNVSLQDILNFFQGFPEVRASFCGLPVFFIVVLKKILGSLLLNIARNLTLNFRSYQSRVDLFL